MNKRLFYQRIRNLCYSFAAIALMSMFSLQGFAQTNTAAGTDIKNTASASYSDGTTTYNTVSNEVKVTVAKVSGLTITPDAQTDPTVVAGQTGVTKTFRVTNIGNFTDDVKFLASGASVRVVGPATITAATAGGTNILTNTAAVLKTLAQNGFIDVVVTLSINANASPASTIQVLLGDQTTLTPTFDNDAATNSANEVNTVATGAVNGSREARGDITTTVQNDALPKVTLTAPSGPVTLGSTISYTAEGCNEGQRTLVPLTGDTQVFIYAPIPLGTQLATYPTGTQFTTDPLSTSPLTTTWVTTAPALSSVTRIRMPIGASVTAGTCASPVTYTVTVTTNNANTPIYEIVDIFGNNSIGSPVTDQSGDNTPNKGDGNANFDEPIFGGTATPNQGFQQFTTLQKTGSVLNGPNGQPGATGPTNTNDDFTNKSVNTGIATVAPGGVTTAAGTVVFTNTLKNTGNANDTYTLTAPTVPTGATVRISTDGGTTYTTVSGGGSTTYAVAFGASANYLVEVTLPAGNTVLTGYDTVIRATSGNTPANFNETIDRLYTGFLKISKSFTIDNQTGVGGATDPVPGADIIYTITYTNVSSTGGTNNSTLTASNVVITEDGTVAPNTWGTTTDQVVGSAVDSSTFGTIVGDSTGSTALTDTVTTLAPGVSGTFTFKRKIK